MRYCSLTINAEDQRFYIAWLRFHESEPSAPNHNVHNHALQDIEVRSQSDVDTMAAAASGNRAADPWYSVTLQTYDRGHSLDQLRGLVTRMTKIERAIAKLQESRGYPGSWADTMGRYLEAAKSEEIRIKVDKGGRNGWDEYTEHSIGDAVNRLRRITHALVEKHKPAD